jgi:adenosylhomocysteine nucleosidase
MRTFILLRVLACVPLASCAAAAKSVVETRAGIPRIAIVSAFDAELTRLRDSATITEAQVINGRTHYIGTLAGHNVVMMLSGVSMVNAAMTTQKLLDHFTISRIVFSGIAGGVNPSLHVGDVTVPALWGNYQEQVFGRATSSGFTHNRTAGEFPNFGMMFPRGTAVVRRDTLADRLTTRFWFPADTIALALAARVAATTTLSRCTRANTCLAAAPRIVVGGRGVSGPTFVDNAEYREWVWSTFKADALDMETAAVALVAEQNGVPFIAFRSLSDLAGGGGASENEVPIFGRLAAENSAAVVMAFLRALPVSR